MVKRLGGIKWLGHVVDHLPPSSAKFKNKWIYSTTPPICLSGVDRASLLFNFAYTMYVSVTCGHFVPTSNSLSWNTVLCKLGKGVVPWVHFWFSFFCFNRITVEFQMLCIVAHIYIWQMALKWEKVKCSKVQYVGLGVTANYISNKEDISRERGHMVAVNWLHGLRCGSMAHSLLGLWV